jgi:hypothetical protein
VAQNYNNTEVTRRLRITVPQTCAAHNYTGDNLPQSEALKAAEAQLAYWKQECEAARASKDEDRKARCERFISQCELVISALNSAAVRGLS